jgi:hypothetical protein
MSLGVVIALVLGVVVVTHLECALTSVNTPVLPTKDQLLIGVLS